MTNTPEKSNGQEEILQRKADILLFVDIVSEHSRKVELAEREALREEFLERAKKAGKVKLSKIQEDLKEELPEDMAPVPGEADDSPRQKERIQKVTRRMLLTRLFTEHSDAKAEERAAEEESRELEPAYFDEMAEELLKGKYSVQALTSWDGKTYFHFLPLMSASYAKLLSAKNNPYQLVLDTIRDNSRIYPRPIGVYTFENPPFNLKMDEIKAILDKIAEDENAKDIRVSITS
ncbi:MAG: hypothetical protein LUC43_02900, partial [Burkholderiales bacterium]|nr:hypothetical protein [Burkholderiales bacterium]